jgi:hypothetical protein
VTCRTPIDYETLTAYWLGELPAAREDPLEEHLFACAQCSARLEQLAALSAAVRAVVKAGRIGMVVSEPFVAAMKRAGLRLREYRIDPGGSVNCTIAADDDAVVSRIRVPLAGVTRLDIVRMPLAGDGGVRVSDIPFDAAAGEVLVIPSAAWLKTMPAFQMRMRLVDVGDRGETTLGEYTFRHSPS